MSSKTSYCLIDYYFARKTPRHNSHCQFKPFQKTIKLRNILASLFDIFPLHYAGECVPLNARRTEAVANAHRARGLNQMAHNIDMTGGRANMAFLGSRKDIWHRLGSEMQTGMSIEDWSKAAGLNWDAVMVPAYRDLSGPQFKHMHLPDGSMIEVDNGKHCVRSDNGAELGYASDQYKPVQPKEVLDWFQQYISVDPHFAIDVAGSLKGGKIIWATATYNGGLEVAGDQHVARLLMTTTFDGTGSTINQGTMTRVVCNNTLNVALSDKRSVIRTRHSTKFNPERVGKELATLAQGFEQFKKMGDAMARVHTTDDDVSKLFKYVLDIPFEAKKDDISTRKMNQFGELRQAYARTVQEGTENGTAWTALNAVTRFVDHDRATKTNGGDATEARCLSSQFGSGAALKAKAVEYLTSSEEFKALLATPFNPTSRGDDVSSILAAPFKPSPLN